MYPKMSCVGSYVPEKAENRVREGSITQKTAE